MSASLLDTNVLSELTRPQPTASVVEYLGAIADGYVSVITLNELLYGAQCVKDEHQRQRLTSWVRTIEESYAENILPVDGPIAHRAAYLRAREARQGRTIHFADSLIAATALVRDLPLATRNTKDFDDLGIDLHNPWIPA